MFASHDSGASSSHNDDSDPLGQESHDDHEQEHATRPAPEASGPAWPDRRAKAWDALRRKREYYAYHTSQAERQEAQNAARRTREFLEMHRRLTQQYLLAQEQRRAQRDRLAQEQRLAQQDRLAQEQRRAQQQRSTDEESSSVSSSVADNSSL